MVVTDPSPSRPDATGLLNRLFSRCEETAGSDLHLASGLAPRLRIQGVLAPIEGFAPLSRGECELMAISLAETTLSSVEGTPGTAVRARLVARGSIDGAVTSPSGSRYRFNIFLESGNPAIALRRLDDRFLPLSALGLPPRLADFCDCRDGLVLVTGPTGSGKSTTLATLIDQINRTRDGHIITIEDPIEYVHHSERCLVSQRQVGRDAVDFNSALVDSLRQDPDVILVGEIREVQTIRTAITAAETGHLVFATLHAGDCAGAIERVISVFPSEEQEGIRHQLAMVLRGILAQHLLPSATGGRRVPGCELLFCTPAVANLIASGRSQQIYSAIESGQGQGMLTLDQSLARLLAAHRITEQVAFSLARNPNLLSNWIRLEREGKARHD